MVASCLFLQCVVHAGFPSPAADYIEQPIDLNEHLIFNKDATYLMRVVGHSMTASGIFEGDEVLVDRSLPPRDGNIVVAVVNGGLTIKRLRIQGKHHKLVSDNPELADKVFAEGETLQVWGVVTRCLHKL